jgi:hypothetical protein
MTPITRKLKREGRSTIFSNGRRRPVVVILEPPGDVLGLRLKGERTTYYLPLDWCYRQAVVATIRAAKRQVA